MRATIRNYINDKINNGKLFAGSSMPEIVLVPVGILIIWICFIKFHLSWNERPTNFNCRLSIVESIPEGLNFTENSVALNSTYNAWADLIESAEENINIVAFYWSLKNEDVSSLKFPSSWQGEDIFEKLLEAGRDRGIQITIAQNAPSSYSPQLESEKLMKEANAKVYNLDFKKLLGGGVLHTKMIVVDEKHFYLGSANMDFRSLTQVKELGYYGQDCPVLASDLMQVFKVYVGVSQNGVPPPFPPCVSPYYDMENPAELHIGETIEKAFISTSPPDFNPRRRTNDLDAILHHINTAEKFIYIAVMDYFPSSLYTKHKSYWPAIDEALRRAAYEREVHVRVLGSHWNHTRPYMFKWLASLQDLADKHVQIETKLFVVPILNEEQEKIPFGRVNHNKYMVTDKTAYVGTSNWSKDYFINTGGVGISITPNGNDTIRQQLEKIHLRDWHSVYAKNLSEFKHTH